MSRFAIVIALPAILGACSTSTFYPPLYSTPSVAMTGDPNDSLTRDCREQSDQLEQTVACAELLQQLYSTGYVQSAKWNDFSQLPIIGAAGAAAWILLKDQHNAASKVGKIGIGTGVYAAARGQLLPSGLPEVFIKGHGALGCVIAEEVYFRGGTADSQFRSLDLSLTETADWAALVSGLRYTEPSDPAASPDLLKAARSLADQAITAANTQLRSSRQERAAHEFAASPFRQAVSDIAGWVASKGRARPNASYDDLLKSMTSAPPKPADGQPADAVPLSAIDRFRNYLSLNPPRTSADLISAIGQSSQLLTSASIELQGNTPPYGARLTKVTKCATDLPSG